MSNKLYKKILVIRFSSLGDVILTTPLLKRLKRKYPESEIHFLTKKSFADVLRHDRNISKIIETEDNIPFNKLKSLKKEIKAGQFDITLDVHNNLRTFYLRLFLNGEKKVLKKYSFRKFLLVKFKINLMKNLPPVAERYCELIPVENAGQLPEIFIDETDVKKIKELITENNPAKKKIICISPASHHFTKTYPAEYYTELIKKLGENYLFFLTGKGKDISIINEIKSKTGRNVINLCDKLSLNELSEMINQSDLFISGDTGPMHIAEAKNKKMITIAGSSVKEFGFYPQNTNAVLIENNLLKCRPCSHIGRQNCPKVHFKCMRDITPESIYSHALKLLQ